MWSSQFGNDNSLHEIIEAGCDVNDIDSFGF